MQCIEPSARLVNRFGNEICGIAGFFDEFFVLERIMILRKRHGAGIEPDIHHFFDTIIFFAVFFQDDFIDIRTMWIKLVVGIVRERHEIAFHEFCIAQISEIAGMPHHFQRLIGSVSARAGDHEP